MDFAHTGKPTCRLETLRQNASVGKAVLNDLAVAGEAEMDEVVVLHDDMGARSGEVERVRLLGAAQVVQLEDQVAREEGSVSPDDPAEAGGDEAVFMSWLLSVY